MVASRCVYLALRMNVRVHVLYWMDECLLNQCPTIICLALKNKNKKNKKNDQLVSETQHTLEHYFPVQELSDLATA